jgi:polysaccharide biosynthesis/export protein
VFGVNSIDQCSWIEWSRVIMRNFSLAWMTGWMVLFAASQSNVHAQYQMAVSAGGCENCGIMHPAEACLGGCQPTMQGVDCAWNCGAEGRWADMAPMNFQPYAQGEYAGPSRLAHLAQYRLRPNDQLQVIYILTRQQISGNYRLMIGDSVMLDSISNEELVQGALTQGITIQPDGSIFVKLLGSVHAAGLTISQLRKNLEEQYTKYYPKPAIDVMPVKTNTLAEDIRNAVGGASGLQQQTLDATVTPDGKIQLPIIGEISGQGMTITDLKQEINLRYLNAGAGLVVEPRLVQQANHFVFVTGEVGTPGQVQLQGPTTVSGAIAAAGGWRQTGNLRNVVVLRRAEDWRLIATMVDIRGVSMGRRPTPVDEIWLRDGGIIIVPPTPITVLNGYVRQIFTEGIYGVIPFAGVSINFDNAN